MPLQQTAVPAVRAAPGAEDTRTPLTENALRESERHLRAIFDGAHDALSVLDDRRVIVDVNPSACRLFARSKPDLLGQRCDDVLACDRDFGDLWSEGQSGESVEGGFRMVSTDGVVRDVEYSLRPHILHGRHLLALRDVTERKQIEATQRRLAAIVESSDDAIVSHSLDGTVESWNAGATHLYGYEASEVIGRPIALTVPVERMAEIDLLWARFERGEHVQHYETVRLRRDGTRIPVSLTVSAIQDEASGIIGASTIARDITERKQFERAVQEKNLDLERANLAKDRFLAGMSHELRTPLNAVIGFTGTLLMRLPGPLTNEQERQLKTIQVGARHLLSLINEILDVAKIESGAVDLKLEETSCQELLQEVSASIRPLAEAKGLRLDSSLPDRPVVIRTDRRAVRQIVTNLAGNAVKFTERGSVLVGLETTNGDGPPRVRIRVTDTGAGIAEEDLTKLFRPFTRLHAADGIPREGTGLGLHLSQKLAHLLGGKIEVRSEPERGSEFTLELPQEDV